MLANSYFLRNDADKSNQPHCRRADEIQEERCKISPPVAGAREDPKIGPGIEILFYREQENIASAAALDQLSAIGVPFPANAAEQFPVGRANRDQITTAAMIRPEH